MKINYDKGNIYYGISCHYSESNTNLSSNGIDCCFLEELKTKQKQKCFSTITSWDKVLSTLRAARNPACEKENLLVLSHIIFRLKITGIFYTLELALSLFCYFGKLTSPKLSMWLTLLSCRLTNNSLGRPQFHWSLIQLYFLLTYNSILWLTLSAGES